MIQAAEEHSLFKEDFFLRYLQGRHGLSSQIRWIGSSNEVIAFLSRQKSEESRKNVLLPCVGGGEPRREWCSCLSLPVESLLEVEHSLNLLHLPKALTSLGLLPARDFTGRNGETELICVPRALFLHWNCFHFWNHFSDCSCMRKGYTCPFLWRPNKRKACLYYIYILIAQHFCSWLLPGDTVEGKASRLSQEESWQSILKGFMGCVRHPSLYHFPPPPNLQQNRFLLWAESGGRALVQAVGSGRCRWLWLWQGSSPRQSWLLSAWCLEVALL